MRRSSRDVGEHLTLERGGERDRAFDVRREARVAARGVARALGERLDHLPAAAVGDVHELLHGRPRGGRGVEDRVDRVAAGGLDTGGQALGGEHQRRQLVVLAGIALEERAASDVVKVRREEGGFRVDGGRAGTARGDERLGDAPDEPAVRPEPVRVPVAREVRLRGCGQHCQSAIDTIPGPA